LRQYCFDRECNKPISYDSDNDCLAHFHDYKYIDIKDNPKFAEAIAEKIKNYPCSDYCLDRK
jgi:hypothetical protein